MPLKNDQFVFAMTENVKSFLTMGSTYIYFVLHVLVPLVYQ